MKFTILKVQILIIFLGIFFISGCSVSARYRVAGENEEIHIDTPLQKLEIGERFTYKVKWLGMDVGIVTLSIEGITEMNGVSVYSILATAQTISFISKIYRVEDEIRTYLDVKELYPVRFEKRQREGSYISDEYTDFDQKKNKAYYFSRLNHTKKEYDIPMRVQDPLSCIYYFRLKKVKLGKSIFANVNSDETNYLVEAKIHKKGFVKIGGLGEWESFMVEPLPWFQGKVRRKAKATIWFSADEKRIPLLVTTRGIPLVGTISIILQNIEGLDTEKDR